MECLNKYATVFMCIESKSHPFSNERHTICCDLTSILWKVQKAERKDISWQIGEK